MSFKNVLNQNHSLEHYLEITQSDCIMIADLRFRTSFSANHFDDVVKKAGLSSSFCLQSSVNTYVTLS